MREKPKHITVVCDIYFNNFMMKNCIFKLRDYNGEYRSFYLMRGTHHCKCEGSDEYVNLNRACRVTIVSDDYEEVTKRSREECINKPYNGYV